MGAYTAIGDIPAPYQTFVFAQDLDRNLNYINGNGIHHKSQTEGSPEMQATGVVFPTDDIPFFSCGEFDGSDIIAAPFDIKGGVVRYSLLTSTTTYLRN